MRKMKETEVAWLNFIPENWECKRLKNVLKERKENNNPIKTENILSLTNDKGVIPYSEKENRGNKAKDDLTGYKLAYPNDIVMNSMNVVIGSVGLSQYYGCVSPVYYMLYSDKYDIRYYNYIFQSKIFQNELRGLGNGILEIRMRIPMEKMNNVIMPIPPRNEQEKIANFLDKKICEIDNIIIKTKETIEDYKKYKQAIITEVVIKGLEKRTKLKNSGIEWVKKIPESWGINKIKNICRFNPNYTDEFKAIDECGYIPMELLKFGYAIPSKIKMSNASTGLTKFIDKDIIMAKVTPCFENGEIAIVDKLFNGVGLGSSELFVFNCSGNKVKKEFLFYLLQNILLKDRFTSTMIGVGGLKRVSPYYLKNSYIPIPSIEEQKKIIKYLDNKCNKIEELINNKKDMIEELKKYKKSLIYEYVTGKKEVKENNLLKKNYAEKIKINCKDNIFAQAILLCRIIEKLNKHNLGRVKAEKALYLIERDIGFNFENNYVREKAGPLSEAIYKCESVISKKNRWVKINNKKNPIDYEILPNFSNYKKYYKKYYSDYDKKIERIIKIIKDYSMDKAEMVATLYASWNDFIIKEEEISDIKIVKDVRENWNDTKKRFKENEWLDVLKEMKQVGLIPKGKGNLTIIKEQ